MHEWTPGLPSTSKEWSNNTFELYSSDGTTAVNVTSNTVSGAGTHGVVVLSDVQGVFVAGETITGGTSSGTATLQADAVGLNAIQSFDFSSAKQISMAGSPTYTSDVNLTSTLETLKY